MHHQYQPSRSRNSRSQYPYHDASSIGRRSRSSQPYHAVSETYSKEVTHKPLGPVSNFPPEVVDRLRRSTSPPLIRSRENTWTDENFPIVRVPSAQFTDILTEIYDFQEEKFTRRSTSPPRNDHNEPNEQNEFLEVEKKPKGAPTYNVIPPTPEKQTPRPPPSHHGIPLSASESLEDIVRRSQKKPLPMYEEYLKNREKAENEEEKLQNLRHIDSSCSETSDVVPRGNSQPPKTRHVYTHDVYVDSTTGRPFTPGRHDLDNKNCGKLKINVYFKPPHPPVTPTYTLDEIEIEKTSENAHIRLRPSKSASSIKSRPVSHFSSPADTIPRGLPIQTSILRKEHEILDIPLKKRPSSVSTREIQISQTQKTSEIDLDEIFPKMPTHHSNPRQTQVHEVDQKSSKSSTPVLPYTRGISKTPSDQEKRTHHHQHAPAYDRNSKTSSNLPIYITQVGQSHVEKERFERAGSFISSAPSQKSEKPNAEIIIPVHVVEVAESEREKSILPLYENRKPKRDSPEELDYGKFEKSKKHFPSGHPRENPTPELPFQRGISKDGGEVNYRPERTSKTSHNLPIYAHQPGNVDKERYQKSTPSERSSYRTQKTKTPSVYSNPRQTQLHEVDQKSSKSSTPVLPYTRGISKTPSDQEKRTHHHLPSERAPSVYDRASQRSLPRSRNPSVSGRQPRPGHTQNPYEEVVHIKERYERDETIRRFFPTTTTV